MASQLPGILSIDKIWWIKDPVPDWIRQILNREQQIALGKVELQLQTSILQAQLDAAKQSLEILGRTAAK